MSETIIRIALLGSGIAIMLMMLWAMCWKRYKTVMKIVVFGFPFIQLFWAFLDYTSRAYGMMYLHLVISVALAGGWVVSAAQSLQEIVLSDCTLLRILGCKTVVIEKRQTRERNSIFNHCLWGMAGVASAGLLMLWAAYWKRYKTFVKIFLFGYVSAQLLIAFVEYAHRQYGMMWFQIVAAFVLPVAAWLYKKPHWGKR